MTGTMRHEQSSGGFDLATEMRDIAAEVLTIVPPATDTKPLSPVEIPLGESIKLVLANRKNDDSYQSDFIVSRIEITPDQKMHRETYRWSSLFPGSKDLQFYETVGSAKVSTSKKGFDEMDVERLREWVLTAGEAERGRG